VNQYVLGAQLIAISLQGQHHLEITAAKGNYRVLKLKGASAECIDQFGVLPLRVEPQNQTALTDLFLDLGGKRVTGDLVGS
jgi:hypothetical protein